LKIFTFQNIGKTRGSGEQNLSQVPGIQFLGVAGVPKMFLRGQPPPTTKPYLRLAMGRPWEIGLVVVGRYVVGGSTEPVGDRNRGACQCKSGSTNESKVAQQMSQKRLNK
jgi:hypothetical protein